MIQKILVIVALVLALYILLKPFLIKPKKVGKCGSTGKGCGC